ncbi:PqiB family protein [Paracraurococcus lichenis]|uniref:MlaD family protein n=1 Tax=Paracraurococcus lichenis TaxID=3064888 RepID=A0ABT9ED78_9PROT|nr:MlaD family protein [Paracraurococcus sp. LOR1-02]MDO9714175.1 MlaD family protein [Paracraurococcus sp. LOR1-02]
MSSVLHPEASLRARVDLRPRLSPIWLVPLVAVLIAGWLVWDAMAKRGPLITVTFQSAEGLQAGQSHLRHLDVDVGLVESISLNPDLGGVRVAIRTTREAEPLLTENAQFWVVRPRLFAGSLSGLGTLLSGSYVEVIRPAEGGQRQLSFTGLEDPPVLEAHVPGRTVELQASRIGSISVGSPIFFRDLNVGKVLGWDLGSMAESVTIHAFIRAPFDQYLRANSRFWNASGVSVQLGAEGVQLQLESLAALLLGGIAFDTPDDSRVAAGTAIPAAFPLYPSEQAAKDQTYGRHVKALAYFEGSVGGLAAGAPVTFQGLRVGQVTSVELVYDPASDMIHAPVRFEVQPERIADVQPAARRGPVENAKILVAKGLRAQLQSANLLTGQMQVALEMIPDAAPAELVVEGDVLVIPAVPGQIAGAMAAASQLLAKIEKLPLDQMGASLEATFRGVEKMVNSDELRQSLASLQATLAGTQDVVKRLDEGMSPTLRQLPAITASLQGTLTQATRLLASADRGYGDNSRFSRDLERLMLQLNDTARSLRGLTDLLNRHPEALIRGRQGSN